MKNYVLIYFNNGIRKNLTPEQSKAEWDAWFGKLGDSVVDGGNPFNAGGKAVEKSGVSSIEKHAATGYSVVKAKSMSDAVEMTKDCPVLEEPDGAVKVYETMPM